MALTLTVNGQEQVLDSLEDGASLEAVVAALGLKADRVAVELKGEIVSRKRWAGQVVSSGDRLEVVHFVGGGR
jgi:sulfur carrier protein